MLFFIISLIVLFGLSFSGISKRWFFFLLIVLAFFLGFRGITVGDDTSRYVAYYYNVETSYHVGYMEIGWNYLSEFFRSLKFSAYGYHFFIALATLLIWGFVVNQIAGKNNKIRGNALFLIYSLGFYLYMFNGMRQFFAVSIVFLAFYFLANKKPWFFVLFVLFATLFHTSAIFSLLIYPMLKLKMTNTIIIGSLIVTYIFGLVVPEKWFSFFVGKYSAEIEVFGFRSSFMYAISVGLLTNLFYYYLIYNNKKIISDIWMKYFFFSVLVMNILSSVVYGPRIVYYFSFAQTIALAIYMAQVKVKMVKPVIYLYSLITFGRFLLPELLKREGSVFPFYLTIQLFD